MIETIDLTKKYGDFFALESLGLTVAQINLWRRSKGKAEWATLTDRQRSDLCGWLAQNPAAVANITNPPATSGEE